MSAVRVDISRGQEARPILLEGLTEAEELALWQTFRNYTTTCTFHHTYVEALHEHRSDTLDDESIAAMTAADFGCECFDKGDVAEEGTKAQETCSSTSEECDCVSWHGNFYTKATADAPPNLQLDAVPSRHVLYECNEMCACATSKCSNAVVRHGVRIPLRVQPVRDSPESPAGTKAQSSGLGVFAAAPIRKGQFICEYAGELISPTEARRRWSRQASQKQGNYILTIYETASSSAFEASEQELEEVSQLDPGSAPSLGGSRIDIDPREEGNVARFINHLCPPLANVVIAPVRCDGPLLLQTHSNAAKQPEIEPLSEYLHRLRISPLTNQNFPQSAKRLVPAPPRAALFAARDIAAGEQLGFDYADPTQLKGKTDVAALTSKPPSEGLQQQELRTRCLCGSVACRGWLPFDEQTDPAFPMD